MKKIMEFLAIGAMIAFAIVILNVAIPFLREDEDLVTTQQITIKEDGGYTVIKRVTKSTETDTACIYVWFRANEGNKLFPANKKGDMSTITCADRNGDGVFEDMYFIFKDNTSGLLLVGDDQSNPESWVCDFPNGDPDKMLTDQEKEHFVHLLNEINTKI